MVAFLCALDTTLVDRRPRHIQHVMGAGWGASNRQSKTRSRRAVVLLSL